ncbi:hypothetical protein RF11_16430 [Thelohanellus kitauei]|uniref:Alpha-soluble NSF attachment protein n=1 Tax=Thelohanellus kitauei TaxID=669202 RepID=A0A0C2IWA8_THEKT|nr:hypothetical protein RF11_16430 [Thelohanellus kitauei]
MDNYMKKAYEMKRDGKWKDARQTIFNAAKISEITRQFLNRFKSAATTYSRGKSIKSINPKDEYWDYMKLASDLYSNGKWADAGAAYFKAGKVAENKLKDFTLAHNWYKSSADCYREILSCSAYESYRKYVEVLLKQRLIKEAIVRSLECGYIIEKEFNDALKSKEFYDLANDLRFKYNYKHICTLTPNFWKKFCDRTLNWRDVEFSEVIKYQRIFNVREEARQFDEETSNIFILIKETCSKCVYIWSIHSKTLLKINDTVTEYTN